MASKHDGIQRRRARSSSEGTKESVCTLFDAVAASSHASVPFRIFERLDNAGWGEEIRLQKNSRHFDDLLSEKWFKDTRPVTDRSQCGISRIDVILH